MVRLVTTAECDERRYIRRPIQQLIAVLISAASRYKQGDEEASRGAEYYEISSSEWEAVEW